jgi:hypothetical protein
MIGGPPKKDGPMRSVASLLLLALAGIPLSAHAKGQFVDRTEIILPTDPGQLHLKSSRTAPTSKGRTMVVANYEALRLAPKATITVELIPAGIVDESKATDDAIDSAYDELEAKAGAGSFKASGFAPATFDKPSASLAPMDLPSLQKTLGMAQMYSYDLEGVTTQALVVVAYRHLFKIRVFVSAPAADLPIKQLQGLASLAGSTLIPAIDIRNFGTCGQDRRTTRSCTRTTACSPASRSPVRRRRERR